MTAILELRNGDAAYGQTQILQAIDLAVEERGITTLLGANAKFHGSDIEGGADAIFGMFPIALMYLMPMGPSASSTSSVSGFGERRSPSDKLNRIAG